MVVKGKPYDSDDPVVKQYPSLFSEPDEYARQETKPRSTDELGSRSMSARRRADTPSEHECGVCGEKAKTRAGLKAHERSHKK